MSATGSGALPLVRRFNPALITLDINLPDMDGWRLLDILKRSPDTRHIPIHIISVEDPRERGLQMGAFSVLEKPVDHATLQQALARTEEFIARPVKELLLVEDDDLQRGQIVGVIGNGDVVVTQVRTGCRSPASIARALVRLRGARPGAAGHGRTATGGDDPPRQLAPVADHRSHRQGRQLRGRGEAAQPGRVVHPQGAGVAPAVVRRDRAVHASARRRHGRRQAPHHRSRATARGRARRTARADRRRRHPQHLLAHRRPRAAPGTRRCTPRAAAKASSSWRRPRTSTWC